MKTTQVVGFSMGSGLFGVEILTVREVVRAPEITYVPGRAGFVLGVIALRGEMIQVVDLARRLGLPPAVLRRESRILVTSANGRAAGFLVDDATEVLNLPAEAVAPLPASAPNQGHPEYISGVARVQNRLVLLVDLKRLLEPRVDTPEALS